MERHLLHLQPRPPFDFPLTAGFHTGSLATRSADSYEDDIYTRVVQRGGRALLARTTATGHREAPELQVEVLGEKASQDEAESMTAEVELVLGIDADLSGFYELVAEDSPLGALCQRLRGLHPPQTASLFESLVTTITGQQVSGSAARAVRAAVVGAYGAQVPWGGLEYYAFPAPASLARAGVDGLRACGLSMRKAEYIWEIAQSVDDGRLDLEGMRTLPDQEFESQLCALRGVGRWTAQWLLARALGRPNAFPAGDLALARTISRLYFEGRRLSEAELEDFSQRWAPYRSYATIYLMAAIRMGLEEF